MKFTSSLFPNTEYDQYKLDRYILYNKNKMRYFHKICLIVLIMSYSFPSASPSSVFELFTVLRGTIQISVTDITRTKDFTFMETFQKVTVDVLTQLGTQVQFSSLCIIFSD